MTDRPAALIAADAPSREKPSNYPEPFASRMAGRVKRPLGDLFGLRSFGVNLTRLQPGSVSALHHAHSRQDECVYILEGTPTLVTDTTELQLAPGTIAGFPAGGTAHHLENRTALDCVFLEIGDRTVGDEVSYPRDNIQARMGSDGKWVYATKEGLRF